MNARTAWRHLGLVPTSDARLVRKAYADKLRDESIASDPDAFARLRNARDIALANLVRESEVETDNFGLGDVSDALDEAAPEAASIDASPLRPPSLDIGDRTIGGIIATVVPPTDHNNFGRPAELADSAGRAGTSSGYSIPLPAFGFETPQAEMIADQGVVSVSTVRPAEALYTLLLEHDVDDPLYPEQIWQGEALIETIGREAHEGSIESSGQIEEWLAELLARAIPRSDPLIRTAGLQFHWEGRVQDRDLPPALDFIVARQKTINFLTAVGDKKHRSHRAWQALDAGEKNSFRNLFVKKEEIAELLATVRRDHQGLEETYFDASRVAKWESRLQRRSVFAGVSTWIFIVIVGLNLIRCAHVLTDKEAKGPIAVPVAVAGMIEPEGDISSVLAAATDNRLDASQLKLANPKLYAVLNGRWKSAFDSRQKLSDYVTSEAAFLSSLIDRSVPRLPYDVIAEYRKVEMTRLQKVGAADRQGCDDMIDGRSRDNHEAETDGRARNLAIKTLLAVDGTAQPRPPQWTYRIPGEIVIATSKRLGISSNDFDAAMRGRLGSITRCTARIALIQSALSANPKDGLKLLREM